MEKFKEKIYTSDAVIAITKAVYEHWQLKQARKAYYIWDAVRSSSDIVLQMPKQKFFFSALPISVKLKVLLLS